MNVAVPHTLEAFDEDLVSIKALIAYIGGMAEEALDKAVIALVELDESAAESVLPSTITSSLGLLPAPRKLVHASKHAENVAKLCRLSPLQGHSISAGGGISR